MKEGISPFTAAVLIFVPTAAVVGYLVSKNSRSSRKIPKDSNAVLIPHVSSLIPYVGSAIDMGKQGVTNFIREKSQKLGNTPFFTATIMGDKCVFIADPQCLTLVFKPKNTKHLDNFSLQKDFTRSVLTMNEQETQETFDSAKMAAKHYHAFLFKGDELERSMEKVQETFHQVVIPSLCSSSMSDANPSSLYSSSSEWTQHNLFEMVTSAIFKATMGPVISDAFGTEEGIALFKEFDKGVIPIFNGFPDFMTRFARKARDKLMSKMSSPEVWDKASRFFQARRQDLLESGIVSPSTLTKANLGILWASVGNSIPAIFWMVYLLIEHPEAWEACRKQVDQVVASRTKETESSSSSSVRAVFTLEELDRLTYLESTFFEALRMYQGNFTARTVAEDFVFDSGKQKYLMEKGSKIMVWWGILHHDPGVFENPTEFRYDRFVGKSKQDFTYADGTTPLTHDPVIPFGGGEHLCPGRKFVSYEARLLVALLMQNFDIRLVQGQTRPSTDPAMVGIGVLQPTTDPKAEVRPRKKA